MKTYNIFTKAILLLSLSTFVACSSDDDAEQEQNVNENTSQTFEKLVFTASVQNDDATRATISGTNIHWDSTDDIAVFSDNANTKKKLTIDQDTYTTGSTTATFTSQSVSGLSTPDKYYYGFYPYIEASSSTSSTYLSFDDNTDKITSVLPSKQTATSTVPYDKSAMLMMACSDKDKKAFAFKNIPAYIKVTIKNNSSGTVKYIKVVANNTSKKLSGSFTASVDEDKITSFAASSTAKNYVELEITASDVETTYYIAALPCNLKGTGKETITGFTLLLESEYKNDADGQSIYQRVSSKGVNLESSKVYDFGTYDVTADTYTAKVLNNVVDLGLPSGTLWTTKNIGGYSNGKDLLFTTNVYDYGQYFAWGEDFGYKENPHQSHTWTSTPTTKTKYHATIGTANWSELTSKSRYRWDTYKWCSRSSLSDTNPSSDNSLIKYKSDGLTLSKKDDVAHLKSDGKYCMPTYTQQAELMNTTYCSYESSTKQYNTTGKYGVRFTSKRYTSRSIWLSAGGVLYTTGTSLINDLHDEGYNAQYWSRSLNGANDGWCIDWPTTKNGQSNNMSYDRRYSGRAIRAVVTNEAIAPTVGDPVE